MSRKETIERAAALGRLGFSPDETGELMRIQRALHRIAERQCNEDTSCLKCKGYGHTEAGAIRTECKPCGGSGDTLGKREASLLRKASVLAEIHGFEVYHQTDPRGCALYVWSPARLAEYNKGNGQRDPITIDACYNSVGTAIYG